MTHPVHPDAENTADVFRDLLEVYTAGDIDLREKWTLRYRNAQYVESCRREYDRKWDDSLLGVHRYGQ